MKMLRLRCANELIRELEILRERGKLKDLALSQPVKW